MELCIAPPERAKEARNLLQQSTSALNSECDLRARTATSHVSLSPGSSWGYLWAPLLTGLPSALLKGDREACPCITAKGRECPARGRRQQRHGVRWADCREACPHPACNLPGTPGCSAFLQASGFTLITTRWLPTRVAAESPGGMFQTRLPALPTLRFLLSIPPVHARAQPVLLTTHRSAQSFLAAAGHGHGDCVGDFEFESGF